MNTVTTDPVEGHTIRSLDNALSELRLQTVSMGGLVMDQVTLSTRAILEINAALAAQVMAREHEVNRLEQQIDREAFHLIALHQPVANDLRLVRAITRIIHELERVGDEAKKMAAFAGRIAEGTPHGPVAQVAPYVRHMSALSVRMLREAIRALDESDITLARSVRARDAELDKEFAAALRQVFTLVMEGEPYLRSTIDTVFALKGLERIGDHAKNISEQVVLILGDESGIK